jgi:hypothetical protein
MTTPTNSTQIIFLMLIFLPLLGRDSHWEATFFPQAGMESLAIAAGGWIGKAWENFL